MPSTRGMKESPTRQTRSQGSALKKTPASQRGTPKQTVSTKGRKPTPTKTATIAVADKPVRGRPARQSNTSEDAQNPVTTESEDVKPSTGVRGRRSVGRPRKEASEAAVGEQRPEDDGKSDEEMQTGPSEEVTPSLPSRRTSCSKSDTTAVTKPATPDEGKEKPTQRGTKRQAVSTPPEADAKKSKIDVEEAPETIAVSSPSVSQTKPDESSTFSPRRSSRAVLPNTRFKDMEMLDVHVGRRKSGLAIKKEKVEDQPTSPASPVILREVQKTSPLPKKDISVSSVTENMVQFEKPSVVRESSKSSGNITVLTDDSADRDISDTEEQGMPTSSYTVTTSKEPVLSSPVSAVPVSIPAVASPPTGVQVKVIAQKRVVSPIKGVSSSSPQSLLARISPSDPKKAPAEIVVKKSPTGKPKQKVIILGTSGQVLRQEDIQVHSKQAGGTLKPASPTSPTKMINIIPRSTILNVSNVGKGGQIRIIPRYAATNVDRKVQIASSSATSVSAAVAGSTQAVQTELVTVQKETPAATTYTATGIQDTVREDEAKRQQPEITIIDNSASLLSESPDKPLTVNQVSLLDNVFGDGSQVELGDRAVVEGLSSADLEPVTVQSEPSSLAVLSEPSPVEASHVITLPEDSLPLEDLPMAIATSQDVATDVTEKTCSDVEMSEVTVPFAVEGEEVTMTDKPVSSASSSSELPVKQSFENKFCEVIQYGTKTEPQKLPSSSKAVEYVMFGNRLVPIQRPQVHGRVQATQSVSPVKPGRVEVVMVDPSTKGVKTVVKHVERKSDVNRVSPVQQVPPVRTVKVAGLPSQPSPVDAKPSEVPVEESAATEISTTSADTASTTQQTATGTGSDYVSGTMMSVREVDTKELMEVSQLLNMVPEEDKHLLGVTRQLVATSNTNVTQPATAISDMSVTQSVVATSNTTSVTQPVIAISDTVSVTSQLVASSNTDVTPPVVAISDTTSVTQPVVTISDTVSLTQPIVAPSSTMDGSTLADSRGEDQGESEGKPAQADSGVEASEAVLANTAAEDSTPAVKQEDGIVLAKTSVENSVESETQSVVKSGEVQVAATVAGDDPVLSLSEVEEDGVILDEATGEIFSSQTGEKVKITSQQPPSPTICIEPIQQQESTEKEQGRETEDTGVEELTTEGHVVHLEGSSSSAKDKASSADSSEDDLESLGSSAGSLVSLPSTTGTAQGRGQLSYQRVGMKTLIKVYPNSSLTTQTVMSTTATQTPVLPPSASAPKEEADDKQSVSGMSTQTEPAPPDGESVSDILPGKLHTKEYIVVHLPEGTDVKQRYVRKNIQDLPSEEEVTMTEGGDYICLDCDYVTAKKSNWFKHRRKHLGIKPHQCPHCDYKAATSSNLKRHVAIHQDIRRFLCGFCQLTFRQKIHLERHIKYKHEEKKVKCPLCDYMCASENPDLKTHIKRRHMPQEDGTMSAFTCSECGLMTVSRRDLKQHMKFHKKGPELKLFCEFCSFVTDCESRLRRHMFIHTKEKPFQCGLCEYRATQKEHVLRHMKTQHEIEVARKPRKVSTTGEEQMDSSSSESESDSKEHPFDRADYSSQDKIFACNHCTMKFAKLINLYKHLYAQHRSVMPDPSANEFQCVVCDFRTNNKKNLLVHMRKHNMQDQTPPSHVYSCVLCRYMNPRRRNLFQHMKKKHGIEIMMKEDGSTNCYLADNTPVVLGREEGDTNVMSLSDIVTTTALDEDSQLQIVTDNDSSSSIPISNIISVEDMAYMNSERQVRSVISTPPVSTQVIYPSSLAEHEAAEAIEGLQALAQQAGIYESQVTDGEMAEPQVIVENDGMTGPVEIVTPQDQEIVQEDSHMIITQEEASNSQIITQEEASNSQILTEEEVMMEGQMVTTATEDTAEMEIVTSEVLGSEVAPDLEEIGAGDDVDVAPVKQDEDQSSIQLSSDQINQLSSGDYVEINGEVYKVEISSEENAR